MATRNSIGGVFQYRRTSFAPSDAPVSLVESVQTNKRRKTTANIAPLPQFDSSLPKKQHAAVESAEPKAEREKTFATLVPREQIDLGLPENQRLARLLELGLKRELETKYAQASAVERDEFKESMQRLLDFLKTESTAESCYAKNPANDELEQREAQLKAIIASYKKELEEWEGVQGAAEQGRMSVVEPPAVHVDDLPEVAAVEDVLAESTKAVESYILQTDHIRSTLKLLESQNRATQSRVREVAASLNERVMAEFGNSNDGDLIPPRGLTSVHTNDLNVSVLTGHV